MTTARGNLGKADTVTIAAIEPHIPTLVEARVLVESFHAMVRTKLIANLDPWIATSQLEPDRVFCEWHHSGQSRGPCRHHRALVEWPDRRADHEAKAGKTPDVWAGEDRPPASPAARRNLVAQTVIEVASEPNKDPVFGVIGIQSGL
jgi:hypothetical protein